MTSPDDMDVAIKTGDAEEIKRLLRENAARANALIRWGKDDCIFTHPLHYVSDMLFGGKLTRGKELPLIEALIEAGADLNFQRDREDGKKSDMPLIGAASLGAEDVGLRLLAAGARPELRGIFGETALHWASMLGEDRLAAALIQGSDVNQVQLLAAGMGDPRLLQRSCGQSWETARGGCAACACRSDS